MEAVLGAASGLVNSVMKQLSSELVEAYVASAQLGLNSDKIQRDLCYTQGLLHEAWQRGVAGDDNPGLQGLLHQLTAKADAAEDALDELHYFIIQDQLDGTQYAVPDLGDGLRAHARHGRYALRHTVGNCLACFSCSCTMQDHEKATAADVTTKPHNASASKPDSGDNDGPVDKLSFNRVDMSKKIKSVIEDIHSLCVPVSELLKIIPHHSSNTAIDNQKRPLVGSTAAHDKLYGRTVLFEQIIEDIISSGPNCSKTLSVLPIVGPGGIGKTTFAQHLYNDKRINDHFEVRVWVCVSTDFDLLKLSQQILSSIGGSNNTNQTTSLDQLQISITGRLKSKRFLIVFDDIWKCNSQGWENLLAPFMKGETKGNMVLVTTRFPSIADMVKTTHSIPLKGLDPDDFFTFFEAFIFDGKNPQDYQDDLTDVARSIAKKLKGSPLAAKTVGRLLKKDLSRKHWMRVLENNEWQKQTNDDDIMPCLRISYDYLPFHLKKCFPYFALFPEDYKFKNLEIMYFWTAIGIINKYENYMEELVDSGFLVKEVDPWGKDQYVLHDLLHELSRSVSSEECLNIYSSASFKVDAIPKSIRHLSFTMEDRYEQNFREEMGKLRSKINISNLRALMIFKEYGETIDEVLKDIFKEIEGLRVLFIKVKSPECLPHTFSKLIHLRCLKISTTHYDSELTLPTTLSRFYHLKFLDLEDWEGSDKLPKDISRLISLCHFSAHAGFHSNVPEVGRMKCLKELKKFCVKKESVGFELSELGELTELGGELSIYNLQTVATKEEATKAKLASKGDLEELTLVWGLEHNQRESRVLDGTTELCDVLDGLEPRPNLQSLSIIDHGVSTGPRWLCGEIRIWMLKSLHLEGLSWVTLPPFGQLLHLTSLTLRNIYAVSEIRPCFGGTAENSFLQLKQIVLDQLPKLIEWVGMPNAHSFSRLEEITCKDCPNLCAVPFLQECSTGSYNHLSRLEILSCPNFSMPPMPHTSTLTNVDVFASPVGRMSYNKYGIFGGYLGLKGYNGALAWHNLADNVNSIEFEAGVKIPWADLRKLNSLRRLCIEGDSSMQSMAPLSNLTSLTFLRLINCENLTVDGFNPLITASNLTNLEVFNIVGDLPRSVAADLVSELAVASRSKLLLPAAGCFRLETLVVDSISSVLVAPVCNIFASTLHTLYIAWDQWVESFTEEEENAFQLLTSLQSLTFSDCLGLPSIPQGLHCLSSLKELYVWSCPQIRSLPKEGIPTSLRLLHVRECSPELHEEAKKLEGTNPDLFVDA